MGCISIKQEPLSSLPLPPLDIDGPNDSSSWGTETTEIPDNKKIANQLLIKKEDLVELSILGSGQSASVYKVLSKPKRAFLALKVFKICKEGKERQAMHEMDALARMKSPYVIEYHGYYECSEKVAIAMEYMDCGTLKDLVNSNGKRSLPEYIIKHIASQITQGFAYLSKEKLLHRDVKPANILVNHKGEIKIADFGLTKNMVKKDTTKTWKGTLRYLSPERINIQEYSYPSDIWGMGLCLVYCALGSHPFPEVKHEFQLLEELPKKDDIISNLADSFSNDFISFVKQCLIMEPSRRATAAELIEHPFLNGNFETEKINEFFKKSILKIKIWEFDSIINEVRETLPLPGSQKEYENENEKMAESIKKLAESCGYTPEHMLEKLFPKMQKKHRKWRNFLSKKCSITPENYSTEGNTLPSEESQRSTSSNLSSLYESVKLAFNQGTYSTEGNTPPSEESQHSPSSNLPRFEFVGRARSQSDPLGRRTNIIPRLPPAWPLKSRSNKWRGRNHTLV